ncbi:MAG: polysaccharide deacetylase family protein [Bryobacteraceae bacterium]
MAQLNKIAANPSFEIESHTFWHPNFKTEKKHLDGSSYPLFVNTQLERSKDVLSRELDRPIDLLAWPFGIYDPFLISRASAAGYGAAFSIECRAAKESDPLMSIPRCLVADEYVGTRFPSFMRAAISSAGNNND